MPGATPSRDFTPDVETGDIDAQQKEMASLLLDRRTSSFDEPHASPLVPNQLHGALHTVTNKSRSQQQCTDATARLKGLSLAAVSTVFQAVISVCAKSLGQSGVPVFQIALVRGFMVLTISYIKATESTQHPFPHLLGKRKWLLILRGSLGFGVACSLYLSLLYLPLSDALVFIFLSPLLVAAFSPVFNKELPSIVVVLAMVISLGGVVMIAQPAFIFGGQGLNKLGLAFGLMQAGFNASARMCVRELRKTETTDVIMLYSGTMQGVLAFVACVTVPRSLVEPQHGWQYALLLLTGTLAYGGGVTLTAALRLVEASLATAMSYLTVVWGLILGYFFFSEVPGFWSLLGAAVVCSTTMLLGWG